MDTDTLDMSILARDWRYDGHVICLHADGARPISLDFKATGVEPPPEGKTLVMQARALGQEIWGIRMLPSSRLWIQPGTSPSRESRCGYITELDLGVSFNPETGSLSVVIDGTPSGAAETFNLTALTPWAVATEGYEILLGAAAGYADRSPLGWTIDCSFRYGEPALPRWSHGPIGEDPRTTLSEAVQDLDNERHWEAMLALASGRRRPDAFDPARAATSSWAEEIANEAAGLVEAHHGWKEGRL